MGKSMNIPIGFNEAPCLTKICEINDSFATGTLKIMYLGNNGNGSHFKKEAVEKALPTLYNVPIVANYDYINNTVGGHDSKWVMEDNDINLVNLTEPCGVVPEHAKFKFEQTLDSSGTAHEYLVAENVILWKRQSVYNHLVNDRDGSIAHSMEIDVNACDFTEDDYMNITDFQFTALCLLGNCDPCFEGSELRLFSKEEQHFSAKMSEMLSELKKTFSEVIPSESDTESERDVDDIEVKGGEDKVEEVNVEVEVETPAVDEPVNEVETELEKPEETTTDSPAAENTEAENDEAEDFEKKHNDLTVELTQLKEDYTALLSEVEELRAFKANYENESLAAAQEELVSEFEDLAEMDEFKEIVEHKDEYSLETFELKLYALRGKTMNFNKKEIKSAKPKLKVDNNSADKVTEPYGGLFKKYGK